MDNKLPNFLKLMPHYDDNLKIDAALIYSTTNRFYFSEFKSSEGLILITREESYFIVDFRYYANAVKQVKNMNVVLLSDFKTTISAIIKRHNLKNILIENEGISLAEVIRLERLFKECHVALIKTKTLDDIIHKLRKIKNDEEVKNIKIAQEISERAFNKILPLIKIGMTEKEIAFNLEFLIRKEGAEAISFDLIVASGKNSAVPHAEPSDRGIESGDFITIDMGAIYNGYHSDMTRTIALGNISEEQVNIYNIVSKSQNKAMSLIKPGVLCGNVDKVARNFINENGYKGYFGHALGHGVGLDIHENPFLSPKSNEILEEGMVITIEPGIYVPDKFGVRIEDMVVVTKNGYENLTKSNKDLIIL